MTELILVSILLILLIVWCGWDGGEKEKAATGKFLCSIGKHDWLDGFVSPMLKHMEDPPEVLAVRTCYRYHCRLQQRLVQRDDGSTSWVDVEETVEYPSVLDDPGSYPELRKLLKTFKEGKKE